MLMNDRKELVQLEVIKMSQDRGLDLRETGSDGLNILAASFSSSADSSFIVPTDLGQSSQVSVGIVSPAELNVSLTTSQT